MKLRVGLFNQLHPEFVGLAALGVDVVVVFEAELVVDDHIPELEVLEEPEHVNSPLSSEVKHWGVHAHRHFGHFFIRNFFNVVFIRLEVAFQQRVVLGNDTKGTDKPAVSKEL